MPSFYQLTCCGASTARNNSLSAICCYILADRLPVATDMHRKIHRRFAEEGITIAFPQRDVHIHPGDMQAAMPGGKGAKGDAPA